MNTSRSLLGLFAVAISVASAELAQGAPHDAKSSGPPNIIVIVADDLGYGDLGFQGGKDIPTPHLDSLAASGTRCTSGYVSCPVCSPTRAGLITGRYQQRFGHEFNPGPPNQANEGFGLPLAEVTLAHVLHSAGYTTGMVGKWHLGLTPQMHPMSRGFDEYFGFLHGAHSYIDAAMDPANPILRGREVVEKEEYLTDAFQREALAFLDRHQKDRFFLYLTFNAVHAPLQAPDKYLHRFESITDPKRQKYAAMLSAMDDAVGAVLDRLAKLGVDDRTLIFFISDNGGPTGRNASTNTPLRGNKSEVYEGGIRVPFIVRWKDHVPAGKQYHQPVISLDIFATAAVAAGVDLPSDRKIDGVNLAPFLSGEDKNMPHESLYWRYGDAWAIRRGPWKLVHPRREDKTMLFNLVDDIGEQHDLIAAKPEVARELQASFDAWSGQMIAPLWRTQRR